MNRADANDPRHESDEAESTAASTATGLAPAPNETESPDPVLVERDRRNAMRLHLMTGALCAVVVILSWAMSTSGGTRVHLPYVRAPLPELCTTKALFGWPCPGCGMTRAFISLGHGRWSDAWAYNPAAFLLFPLVAFQVPWQAVQWWRLKHRQSELPPIGLTYYGIVLLLLLLGQWIVSLVI